jgi:hypothetical protein
MWRKRVKDTLAAIIILGLFLSGAWCGSLYEREQWRPGVKAMTQEIDRLERTVDNESARVAEMVMIVTNCESSNRHEGIYGDGGKAYGIAQIWEATFHRLARTMGRPELRWKDKRDQLIVLSWAIRNGYGKEWTCGRLITDG